MTRVVGEEPREEMQQLERAAIALRGGKMPDRDGIDAVCETVCRQCGGSVDCCIPMTRCVHIRNVFGNWDEDLFAAKSKKPRHWFLRGVVVVCMMMLAVVTAEAVVMGAVSGEGMSEGKTAALCAVWGGELLFSVLKRIFDGGGRAEAEDADADVEETTEDTEFCKL